VRIELGPRDVGKGVLVMVRRDTGAKTTVKLTDAVNSLKSLLEDIHEAMFSKYISPSFNYHNPLFIKHRITLLYNGSKH